MLASDCAETNILMDADSLYPEGFHPLLTDFLPDGTTIARPYTRASAPTPVRYYFVDFGMSARIPRDAPRLVLGEEGADREVPELSNTVPYDPFKADTFILGNVFRRTIHDVRSTACLVHWMLIVCPEILSCRFSAFFDSVHDPFQARSPSNS